MASENTVFYEKLAEAVRNYTCLYDKSRIIPAQTISIRLQIKNPFLLVVLVSKHSQVSKIANCG